MGLDKLRIHTPRHVSQRFLDEMNAEFRLPSDQRQHFQFLNMRTRIGEEIDRLNEYSEVRIVCARKGSLPGFNMIELNYLSPGGKIPPSTVIECNPNNFPQGYKTLCGLVDHVFGEFPPDLKVSRTDLNAELVNVSVQFCYDTVRVPNKRKSSEVGRIWKKKGAETFEVGKAPAQLTVYDKIAELKYSRKNVAPLPEVLTRFEWDYKHDHCPVQFFSELEGLSEIAPFSKLQFIAAADYYDYQHDTTASIKRRTFNALKGDLGVQDAWSILNSQRNFLRNFKEVVVNTGDFADRLNQSYLESIKKFFAGERSDVYAMYGHSN